jgi:putative phosphoribosyl transferase
MTEQALRRSRVDIILVRGIGLPWQPEIAIGAVAEGDVCVLNDALIDHARVSIAAEPELRT